MTGGSMRSQGSGLANNNARGSLVKDFLFSASRRLSTSALQLSVFSPSGTRSDENIPLTSHRETAFIEHVSAHTPFLVSVDHTGRLRTSSLTMDVSSHNGKDTDSGNSSLIDSSSADSYQEFSSGSRSRTTSSSKSNQSLSSVNHSEYQMACSINRHYSTSDSISGSSGKVSLNTSDITETSDGSLAPDKNKESGILPTHFYVNEDTYCESESQPFLYRPAVHSVLSSDGEVKNRSVSDVHDDDCLDGCDGDDYEYPVSENNEIFNSTIININPDSLCHESSALVIERRLKNREKRSSVGYSDCERSPLLEDSEIRSDKKENVLAILNHEICDLPLKRSASLGEISQIPLGTLSASLTPATLDLASSLSPSSDVTSHSRAATSAVSFNPQHQGVSSLHPLIFWDKQPYLRPHSHTKPDSSEVAASHSTHWLVGFPYSHSIQPECSVTAISHHQPMQHIHTKGQLCSNYDSPCRSPFIFSNQYENSKCSNVTPKSTTAYETQPSSPQVAQENSFIEDRSCYSDRSTNTSAVINSNTSNPVQNLESVLGYGTPASVNILKQGFKALKSEDDKPLQVLVPRAKIGGQEINHVYMAKNATPVVELCQEKAYPETGIYRLQMSPQTESAGPMETSPNFRQFLATSAMDESHLQNKCCSPSHPNTVVHSNVSLPEYNHHAFLFGNSIKEQYSQCFNNPSSIADRNMPRIQTGCSQIYLAETQERALFGPFCNPGYVTQNSNLLRIVDSNQCHKTETVNSHQERLEGCESEPDLDPTTNATSTACQMKSKEDSSSNIGSLCTSQHQIHPLTQTPHYSVDSRVVDPLCPTTQLLTDFGGTNEKMLTGQNSSSDRPCQTCHLKRNDLGTDNKDIIKDGADINSSQMDDNGYQAGMMLRVPKACFVTDFFDCHENLSGSRSSSLRHSVPSSIDSGHVENNNESLRNSNISQLGLLKATSGRPGECDYFTREIPDYKYLCIVATVLNPLFGLVAFICNHYARRNLRLHRRTLANNLYFASIAISTVAIFLTLIGGALLIAQKIVLQADRSDSLVAASKESCEDRFFGYDESLEKFFDIDFVLYCEITKNAKIMDALRRYWLEDTHNKQVHKKLRLQSLDTANSTGAGSEVLQVGDREIMRTTALNDTRFSEGTNAIKEQLDSSNDVNNPDVPRMPKPFPKNGTSNNSIAKSAEDPVIPPGLEGEYERFLDGQQRTKVNDADGVKLPDTVSYGGLSASDPSEHRSVWTTTVSNVHVVEENTTGEIVEPPFELEPAGNSNASFTN